MNNFWLIAGHEYRNRVGKRSFLLTTFGIPALMGLIIVVSIFAAISNQSDKPLGYVDQAGVLSPGVMPETSRSAESVPLLSFPDEASARDALEQGEIQAYYVVPRDYMHNRQVQIYYWQDAPQDSVRRDFNRFLRANLAAGQPTQVRPRLIGEPNLTVRTLDGSRQIGSQDIVSVILPFLSAFIFYFSVMTSAGFLLRVVADEKENRTMEILITSMTPEQLIGGKTVGLMGVCLTQLGIWILTIGVGLVVAAQFVQALRSFQVPWSLMFIVLIYFLPAYTLIAAMMTAVGGAVAETRQGQQVAGILNLLFILPMLLSGLVFSNPDSPVLLLFTLFPTTSFITVMLRWTTSVIPFWQLAASWILLVASAGLGMWASARIFRAGMLRYGQSLDLRAVLVALRSGAREVATTEVPR